VFMRVSLRLRLVPLFLLLAHALCAANSTLVLQISNETAPPGGWVQIKVSLTKPQLVATGQIAIDLDPSVFGDIAAVAAFSANGDAYGEAYVSGTHVDADFGCGISFVGPNPVVIQGSGGLGQLRDLPVLVISVPILANAPAGKTASVTADVSEPNWYDPKGNPYTVSVTPGTVTVGGSLSVQNLAPGGGLLPEGAVVRINGTGFTRSTIADIQGVSLSTTQFITPQEIDVTLGAPTELTGKKVVMRNPDGARVAYFSFLQPSAVRLPPPPTYDLQFLFPAQSWSTPIVANYGLRGGVLALENPNLSPIDVELKTVSFGYVSKETTVTIPAGSVSVYDDGVVTSYASVVITSSRPIRAVALRTAFPLFVVPVSPVATTYIPPPCDLGSTPDSLAWSWQIGSPSPPSRSIRLIPYSYSQCGPIGVTASTSSGGSWLSVVRGDYFDAVVTTNPSDLRAAPTKGLSQSHKASPVRNH
jgi:hypothetical protein